MYMKLGLSVQSTKCFSDLRNLPNHGIGGRFGAVDGKSRRADRPKYKHQKHTGGRDEEKLATADFIHEEAEENSNEEVEDLEYLQQGQEHCTTS